MRSRREQLQAYQFLRRRITAALVSGEPETLDPPMQRVVRTTFGGTMVAALLVAAFGIYGVYRPGGATGWKKEGAVVVEKESGASYVYFQSRLHPMLNYASARLYAGDSGIEPQHVSHNSLKGVVRTSPQGILGAPDYLPAPSDLIKAPWSVCAEPIQSGSAAARAKSATGILLAGVAPSTGALTPDEAVVVSLGEDETYLIWRNQRFRVRDKNILYAMGFGRVPPQEVGAAWVNALPQGPDLDFPDIPGRGQPGPAIGDRQTRIGQLLVIHGVDRDRYAVSLANGFAEISQATATLLQADPATRSAYPGSKVELIPVEPSALTAAPKIKLPSSLNLDRYPDRALTPANLGNRSVLCVTLNDTSGKKADVTVSAVARPPADPVPLGSTASGSNGLPLADEVYVPPGTGSVVRAQAQPGVKTGAEFLITDQGVRYPIADKDALAALGYSEDDLIALPPGFLGLLPTGPVLSRQAAQQVATGSAQQSGSE